MNNAYDVLIDSVINQITRDLESGDTTTLAEMLSFVPSGVLNGYLPEELTEGDTSEQPVFPIILGNPFLYNNP